MEWILLLKSHKLRSCSQTIKIYWWKIDYLDKKSIIEIEEIEKKEALEKYGAEGSGKNLPFSSLSDDLKKKEKKSE